MEIQILGYFPIFPVMSLRQSALEFGLSINSIYKILVENNFHSFAVHVVQQIRFCENITISFSQDTRRMIL